MMPNSGKTGGDEPAIAAELALWMKAARERARDRYRHFRTDELEALCAVAEALAARSSHGERDFELAFDAELQRAVEEREVLGAADAVLPASSSEPSDVPVAFTAPSGVDAGHAESPETGPAESPPAEPPPAELTPAEPGPETRSAPDPVEATEPAPEPDAREHVLAVADLRFREGLTPSDIERRLEIEHDVYVERTMSVLREVDAQLQGTYEPHLDREGMARFAAGLASIEQAFSIERHVRECPTCAVYLADLLYGAVSTVMGGDSAATEGAEDGDTEVAQASEEAPEAPEASDRILSTHEAVSIYTRLRGWGAGLDSWRHEPPSRTDEEVGVPPETDEDQDSLRVTSHELRRYVHPHDRKASGHRGRPGSGRAAVWSSAPAMRPTQGSAPPSQRRGDARGHKRARALPRSPVARAGYVAGLAALLAGGAVEGVAQVTGRESPTATGITDLIHDAMPSRGDRSDEMVEKHVPDDDGAASVPGPETTRRDPAPSERSPQPAGRGAGRLPSPTKRGSRPRSSDSDVAQADTRDPDLATSADHAPGSFVYAANLPAPPDPAPAQVPASDERREPDPQPERGLTMDVVRPTTGQPDTEAPSPKPGDADPDPAPDPQPRPPARQEPPSEQPPEQPRTSSPPPTPSGPTTPSPPAPPISRDPTPVRTDATDRSGGVRRLLSGIGSMANWASRDRSATELRATSSEAADGAPGVAEVREAVQELARWASDPTSAVAGRGSSADSTASTPAPSDRSTQPTASSSAPTAAASSATSEGDKQDGTPPAAASASTESRPSNPVPTASASPPPAAAPAAPASAPAPAPAPPPAPAPAPPAPTAADAPPVTPAAATTAPATAQPSPPAATAVPADPVAPPPPAPPM